MEIGEQKQGSTYEVCRSQPTVLDALQLPMISRPLQTNQMLVTGSSPLANGLTPQLPYYFPPHQIPHQQVQHHQLRRPDQQLQIIWTNQMQEIRVTADFRNHNLPLARIKKIMKADEDVKMIAAETPMLFSRACEMFILELTHRSWGQAEHGKRRTLQRSDISTAIAKCQLFDFLVDIVPMEELKDVRVSPEPGGAELNDSIPYFCDGSTIGRLLMDMRHSEMDSHGLPYIQQNQDCMIQQMHEQQHTT